ncbi:MAG: hypothetical protein HYS58_00205 [Elusimicrobia bacterium]|nr:hypothetical protein [Elusimicrobiota bacterium]MBI4217966.1 hypothetical protein [Elusimicrobiota bacterium]
MEPGNESKDESRKNSCCSRGHCCCGKAIAAFVLLSIGGIIGYLLGTHCSMYKMACLSQKAQSNCPMVQPTQGTPQPAK